MSFLKFKFMFFSNIIVRPEKSFFDDVFLTLPFQGGYVFYSLTQGGGVNALPWAVMRRPFRPCAGSAGRMPALPFIFIAAG